MKKDWLKVVSIENGGVSKVSSSKIGKLALKAKFERLWLIDPDQFNPNRNCMERERLERTWGLLCKNINVSGKRVADIGCGSGILSRRLRDAGAEVDAIDIAENALKHVRNKGVRGIQPIQDTMPMTSLADDAYDLVVCTELIAQLPADDHRLVFSELSRIIKADGAILFSTGIDIYSVGVLPHLLDIIQSELEITHSFYSYHSLHIRLRKALACSWKSVKWLCEPAQNFLKQSRSALFFCEKISRFWGPESPSHYILIAKKKPLPNFDAAAVAPVRLSKKQIWE